MFKLDVDDRLSSWADLRAQLETCEDPFQTVTDFWYGAPYVPYNNQIDPWEIILHNKYDDFTKALMMAYSIKFTQRFNNSVVELRTYIDKVKNAYYNIVCVDDLWAINYYDNAVIPVNSLPDSFLVENLIEVRAQR